MDLTEPTATPVCRDFSFHRIVPLDRNFGISFDVRAETGFACHCFASQGAVVSSAEISADYVTAIAVDNHTLLLPPHDGFTRRFDERSKTVHLAIGESIWGELDSFETDVDQIRKSLDYHDAAKIRQIHQLAQRYIAGEATRNELLSAYLMPSSPIERNVRGYVLKLALELIVHGKGPHSTGSVAAAIGVSRRTLQYAFREGVDMTVNQFIRYVKLLNARRDLLAAKPTEKVGPIVLRHFDDHSLFARYYKHHFGESPAATLRQTPRDVQQRLPPRGIDGSQSV